MHTAPEPGRASNTTGGAGGGGGDWRAPRIRGATQGRQRALNGRLLLQETFRAWEAFICFRSQGCFSKDFQVFLGS